MDEFEKIFPGIRKMAEDNEKTSKAQKKVDELKKLAEKFKNLKIKQ